jgi:hypothetical protein
MPQVQFLLRLCVLSSVVAGCSLSQSVVRWATRAEMIDINKAVHNLVAAANRRDAQAVRAGTTTIFDAAGAGWAFGRDGMAPWSALKANGLGAAELSVLTRHAQLLSDDVAVADGFFRTTGLPTGDLSGDVTATMLKREGVWVVATARFAPLQATSAVRSPLKIAKTHMAPKADGWVSLFNGQSLDAFVSPASDVPSASWQISEGLLTNSPSKGIPSVSLLTKDTYTSFELEFEWKVATKGNSGLKYRLFYLDDRDGVGYEYQLADDAGDAGAIRRPVERTGALYGLIAPTKAVVKPAGEFNQSRLVVRGRHCEHWLNGEKVVEYETELSRAIESPFLLQHHGTDVWFRKIRVRRLE